VYGTQTVAGLARTNSIDKTENIKRIRSGGEATVPVPAPKREPT
jgi:hypothetical protein